MTKFKKMISGVLVLGMAVGAFAAVGYAKPGGDHPADTSADTSANVLWTVQKFVELSIDSSLYNFGTIAGGGGSAAAENAHSLTIFSNIAWTLSSSVAGLGSDRLLVSLSSSSGSGDAVVSVGYSLSDLRSMEPGDYVASVTYTVAAE